MARIDIKSAGGASLDAGILQLENGVAMDATLRKVADQNNTVSPLLLSTALVQTTSTLKITTADNPYIDAEHNSGNNRFTVGRDPSSQQVNVDFASNPTGSTTAVGAIRTYGDGVNLSEAMTFREDGNIGIGTNTPGAKLDVHSAANTVAQFNRTGTGNSQIQHLMTGTARWTTGFVSATGNYSIYDNVNSLFRTNLSNTGKLTIGNGDTALTGQLNVKGSGSTSATTSLLVQNSAATQLFSITDDGSITQSVGGATFYNGLTVQFAGIQLNNNGPLNTGGSVTATGSSNRFGNFNILTTGNAATGFGVSTEESSVNFQGDTLGSTTIGSQFTFRKWSSTTATLNNINSGIIRITKTGFNSGNSNNLSGNTLWIEPTYNFSNASITGTTVRGIYYNPTLTSLTNTTHYGIHTTSGGAYINTATPNASAALQADSTTQGFLPPRMTTAQKVTLAATAATGLMIYDTNLNKLCVYTGAGWETITSI